MAICQLCDGAKQGGVCPMCDVRKCADCVGQTGDDLTARVPDIYAKRCRRGHIL